MTFGPITVNRPGATAVVGIFGPKGTTGNDGKDGVGIQGPPVFLPLVAWVSGATYAAGSPTTAASFVSYNDGSPKSGSYACVVTHTSGNFLTDLAAGLWEPVATSLQGTPGTPGATWYPSNGLPAAQVGNNGDFCFRTDTYDVLFKVSGAWTLLVNLKGLPGLNGSTIQTGTGAPPNTLGANGDSYLDLTPSAPRLFGPKANGAWPSSGISLLGSGAGSMNPSGSFTVGHVLVAGTADGKIAVDGGALGDAAFKSTGQVTGTLAAGDDSRITGALQAVHGLGEVGALGPLLQAIARRNLGTLSRGRALALAITN